MVRTKSVPDEAAEKRRLEILGQIKAFDLPFLEEGTPAFVSLEASLLQHGCINPIVMRGDEVISGRARKAICDKHGIKYEIVQVDDLSEADLVSLHNDLNFVGRKIDTAKKKEYAKHLLLATKGDLSNRAVGSMAAVDKKTVQVTRDELEASGEIPHTLIRYSRDGRSQDVSDKVEADEGLEDEYPQLVCFDGPSPEELPKHVYEANKDKVTIVRRKVDRQEGENYLLANGKYLTKCYGHPTWVEAHDSLLAAVQSDQEAKADDIEYLGEERKKFLSELKNIEAHIATTKKEKQKIDLRLKKVEEMVPPKGAEAETEEAVA